MLVISYVVAVAGLGTLVDVGPTPEAKTLEGRGATEGRGGRNRRGGARALHPAVQRWAGGDRRGAAPCGVVPQV